MKKSTHTLMFICCVLLLTSCKDKIVQGGGNVIKHEIAIDIYSEIEIDGAIDVIYSAKPDEAAYLLIETDDNIVPLIDVEVKGRTLYIKAKENINPTRFILQTNSPSLKQIECKGLANVAVQGAVAGDELTIEMKGTGSFTAENLIYDKAKFELKGSGMMQMAGQVHEGKIEISGSGNIQASELVANKMDAKIKGTGNIEVNALDELSIEIRGKGTVAYKGNPQIKKQKIQGTGLVKVLQ